MAGQTIAQRPRPEYDPIPIDVGSFQMFPSIEAGVVFDSNIYSQQQSTADVAWIAQPALTFFSNWNRHALSFGAQADFGLYTDHWGENYRDGLLNMRGRFDLANRTYINYGADYQRLTEARGSPDNIAQATPIEYNYYRFYTGGLRKQGRVSLEGQYAVRRFDYDPLQTAAGGEINLNFRNRFIHTAEGKLEYEVMRFWQPFVKGTYNWRDFEANAPQNSQGFDAVFGSGFEFSGGKFTGEAYAGYMSQDYRNWNNADGAGNTTSDFKFGGNLLWNITGLTSLAMEADRTLEDTLTTGYRSFISTGGSFTAQHELRRNILLEGKAGFTRYDFNGAPNRQDDQFNAGAGVRYFFNRHFYSDLQYDFDNRISSIGAFNYDRHVAQLRFGAQM